MATVAVRFMFSSVCLVTAVYLGRRWRGLAKVAGLEEVARVEESAVEEFVRWRRRRLDCAQLG